MLGLVLWFDDKTGSGLVWCEDQGPLACIRPKETVLEGIDRLEQGQLIRCTVATRDEHRTVMIVAGIEGGIPPEDLRDILTQKRGSLGKSPLTVVA
ncbi:hypothetical protein [Aliiroseovarius sp. S253]|uniref:hypothetical protein n=1 Tax=Aliiroseovarius sp. S253 TaxID=3415133 RepID=UPI003C7DCB4A